MSQKRSNKQIGVITISISLPEELMKVVEEMAKVENRSRSNFIANVLQQLIDNSKR